MRDLIQLIIKIISNKFIKFRYHIKNIKFFNKSFIYISVIKKFILLYINLKISTFIIINI